MVERRVAGAGGAGRRIAQATGRKRTTEARVEAALQFSKHYRQERKDADAAGFGDASSGVALNSANQRRERHRQGADSESHSLGFAASGQSVCACEHWLDSRGFAGVATLRPRQGCVYERRGVEKRAVRSCGSGNDFLRRDCDDQPRNAGEAVARDSGTRIHAARRYGAVEGGCTNCRGVEYRAANAGARRAIPRGFVPPLERDSPAIAAPARPARRRANAADAFHGALLPGKYEADADIYAGRDEIANGLRLAGQRARIGKRRGARSRAFDVRTRGRGLTAREHSEQRDCARRAAATFGIYAAAAGRGWRARISRKFAPFP